MPIEVKKEDDGKTIAVHVSGNLKTSEYAHFASEVERQIRDHGDQRVLFDLTGLQGWEPGVVWEDIKFDVKHFADIERLAIVGDKQWHHAMTAFIKPFTKASVRYFDHAIVVADARKWLDEG